MATNQASGAEFIEEALRIVKKGEEKKIPLRLMGGFAIRLHSPNNEHLYEALDRKPAYDLDFVTYGKHRPLMKKLFADLGYTPMVSMALLFGTGKNRAVYKDENHNRSVDVFFDKLEMCHAIEFKDRLELDYPTISLSDLLLQKIQICQINEKDIKDVMILLREHQIGETDKETVNIVYIAKLLARDWGFWYSSVSNLKKTKEFLAEYKNLTDADREDIEKKITRIAKALEDEPKSVQWKLRSKIGTSKRWYTEVEELVRYG
ncbi:hypothetical protein HXY33_00445 [Candidatus Bathyarchaeota archaeon]|nr:hypothetical protein [Candidatus Bathyarchaeota archaeon]